MDYFVIKRACRCYSPRA